MGRVSPPAGTSATGLHALQAPPASTRANCSKPTPAAPTFRGSGRPWPWRPCLHLDERLGKSLPSHLRWKKQSRRGKPDR